MNKRTKKVLRMARIYLTSTLTNDSPQGSGLGVYLRTTMKRLNFSQIIGVHLAGLAFFAGIVIPQTKDMVSSLEVVRETQKNVIVVEQSASIFRWPLKQFGISQGFSMYHPGMDLTDPIETPIHPIADGVVAFVQYQGFGYGHHALITHENGMQSLYAHMSKVLVHEGDHVTKDTVIGFVGVTGWTTGSHLHFEIYQDGSPTNPMEILPEIKFEDR